MPVVAGAEQEEPRALVARGMVVVIVKRARKNERRPEAKWKEWRWRIFSDLIGVISDFLG